MKVVYSVLAVGCRPGADIQQAIPEAIEAAKAAGQMIYLLHNVMLRVFPDSTPAELIADYYVKLEK
jgi:hypothetical protein